MRIKIFEFLGLKKNTFALLVMVILVGMGERMAERFLPIYLLALGGGILSIGYLNGANNLLNAIYAYVGGYVSDHLGYKRALFLFKSSRDPRLCDRHCIPLLAGRDCGFLVLPVVDGNFTSRNDGSGIEKSAGRETNNGSLDALFSAPHTDGARSGGRRNFHCLVWGKGGRPSCVRLRDRPCPYFAIGSAGTYRARQPKNESGRKSVTALGSNAGSIEKICSSRTILIRFCEQIPYAFVVVWSMKVVGISAVQFGILTAIEMATAALIYIPTAYFSDKGARKPFVVITFWIFAAFPLVLLFSNSYFLLIIAFIVRGLKEFGEPSRKAQILDLAPEDKKAGMFGLYYLLRDVIVSLQLCGRILMADLANGKSFDGLCIRRDRQRIVYDLREGCE